MCLGSDIAFLRLLIGLDFLCSQMKILDIKISSAVLQRSIRRREPSSISLYARPELLQLATTSSAFHVCLHKSMVEGTKVFAFAKNKTPNQKKTTHNTTKKKTKKENRST